MTKTTKTVAEHYPLGTRLMHPSYPWSVWTVSEVRVTIDGAGHHVDYALEGTEVRGAARWSAAEMFVPAPDESAFESPHYFAD